MPGCSQSAHMDVNVRIVPGAETGQDSVWEGQGIPAPVLSHRANTRPSG